MNQQELDLKILFDEMGEFLQNWMSQMASLNVPVGPGVLAMATILEEHKKILLEVLKEMIEEGYPL